MIEQLYEEYKKMKNGMNLKQSYEKKMKIILVIIIKMKLLIMKTMKKIY